MVLTRLYVLLLALAASSLADPVDWVNVEYVIKQAQSPSSATQNSQNGIATKAGNIAENGPWTIQTKGIKPPSGDVRDYLSWAPYHWPDCNWCSKGSSHYANPNATYGEPDDTDDPDNPGSSDGPATPDQPDGSNPDSPPGDDGDDGGDDLQSEMAAINFLARLVRPHDTRQLNARHRMKRIHRGSLVLLRRQGTDTSSSDAGAPAPSTSTGIPSSSSALAAPTPPLGVVVPQPPPVLPTTSDKVVGTQAPAEAPAKTNSGSGKCTPSPTKSLAPSATWTTCPYVVRDGKVNPDTDKLVGPDAAQDMSQSVVYNSVASAVKKSSTYSQSVGNAIDAFFLSSSTGMHPNVNFGQLVRGPGKDHQVGTFTGILDLRGMVKVANGVQILRNIKSPDWTSAREQAMMQWMQTYVSWLQNSDLGKSVASKANNHLTFYIAQLTAVKYFVGDTKGATESVKHYFSNQFLDQVAQSGEQPFEAVRTRPFHYRCFNLEAMIANAKLGDQLGINLWTAKSKYGATIQTALDFTMGVDPKNEDVSDIFPHVAAIAAAYGDPKGKYNAFLQKHDSDYKSRPYWFYDQSTALPNSPAGKAKQSVAEFDNSTQADSPAQVHRRLEHIVRSSASVVAREDEDPIPFECPAVFDDVPAVELEDGLFVTCDQLRPFYELPLPVDTGSG